MLNKINIGPKLIGGFVIVALIALCIGIVGVANLKKLDAADTFLYKNATVPIGLLGSFSAKFQQVRVNLEKIIIETDSEKRAGFFERIALHEGIMADAIAEYKTTLVDETDEEQYRGLTEKYTVVHAVVVKTRSLVEAGDVAGAIRFLHGDAQTQMRVLQDHVENMTALNLEAAKNTSGANTVLASNSANVIIATVIIGVVLALLMGIFLTISITRPLNLGVSMMQEMAKGHLGTRLKMNREDEIGQLSDAMDGFADDLQTKVIAVMQQIAVGDLSASVKAVDAQDEISPALIQTITAIKALVADAVVLSVAAVEGKLSTRADASKHQGDYRKIVQGVDDCLDAVIGPLNVAAEYVEKISQGNIPAKIKENYNGDFNFLKNNLNTCIDAVNALVIDAGALSAAAVAGKLATRADASKHQGDFRKIVQGVDDCLDAVIGPLNVAADYVDRISKGNIPARITDTYNGDFNVLKNNLNTCVDAVNALVSDAGMLAQAAVEGKLSTRADASKHQGDFRKIVQGVNDTLDGVIGPVNEAAEVMGKVAARDMTARVKGIYKGDMDTFKTAINQAVENVDLAMTQVGEATEQVASASGQISEGSQSLAQGANEQASSLEEISSSLEEMASMTRQNADNAQQAKTLSLDANNNAAIGTKAMGRMAESINLIKESSDQTAKIVKTIDEIAMQTNLLALNAAVEAARAGEAGRGFAVVAEEVRNLAQRSAQAAKNTADMIAESVKNAEGGVKIAEEVGKSFAVITDGARKVNDLIGEIAAASQEQSQGIEQVNEAVAQMDKVTQQNAANSEESASSAEELSSQAVELQNMIAQFSLSATAAASRPGTSRQIAAAAPAKRPAVSYEGFHAPARKVALKKPAAQKVHPSEVIPLDDEDLKDF